jgi:geranylgeranyl reductase family protein
MIDIAVVGGGPAGSYLAYCLAKNGIGCTIFDDSHPREKPCGGGITSLALRKFPILRMLPSGKVGGRSLVLVAPSGRTVTLEGDGESWNVSREKLDSFLLSQAVSAGARHVNERVTGVQRTGSGWKLRTASGFHGARTLIGADGVGSIVRRTVSTPFGAKDLAFCYGCFTEPLEDKGTEALMEFFSGLPGYGWVFPREDDCSIGIVTDRSHIRIAKKGLSGVVGKYASGAGVRSSWGALIPSAGSKVFFDAPCAGSDWALIGDAAGHVDPITGEGIIYALWSASLAAEAIAAGDLPSYDMAWRKEYGRNLADGARSKNLYYNSTLIELSVALARRSKTFGGILYDAINDEVGYGSFTGTIMRKLPRIAGEALVGRKKKGLAGPDSRGSSDKLISVPGQ